MVDLAYSGEGDDCLFYADDFCLVIAMEKTRLISRDDTVEVYITCFGIEEISLKVEYAYRSHFNTVI